MNSMIILRNPVDFSFKKIRIAYKRISFQLCFNFANKQGQRSLEMTNTWNRYSDITKIYKQNKEALIFMKYLTTLIKIWSKSK